MASLFELLKQAQKNERDAIAAGFAAHAVLGAVLGRYKVAIDILGAIAINKGSVSPEMVAIDALLRLSEMPVPNVSGRFEVRPMMPAEADVVNFFSGTQWTPEDIKRFNRGEPQVIGTINGTPITLTTITKEGTKP